MDSSKRLLAENCRDHLGKICLLESYGRVFQSSGHKLPQPFPHVQDALVALALEGYEQIYLGIANIVHGDPTKNEPRAVILLHKEGGKGIYSSDVLISRGLEGEGYLVWSYRVIE
ncbi:MAG TPA: hypothetical protein HA233_00740 [Nanoarchaeota archaeon]|nr:hypothetical protein [Nanoarchaeota archaeon]